VAARTAKVPCDGGLWAYPDLDPRKVAIRRSLHYLHGYIDESSPPTPGNIVLARDEFAAAYRDGSALMNTLIPTLENDPVVFIGCRQQDEYFALAMAKCETNRRERLKARLQRGEPMTEPPRRYILISKELVFDPRGHVDLAETERKREKEEANYLRMGLIPHWYSPEYEHAELVDALETVAGLQKPSRSSVW
jgi:hypothetical protein